MQDYQQRVVDEKRELDEKLVKLTAFINGPAMLSQTQADLLRQQEQAMQKYSLILGLRIDTFNK